MQIKHKSKSDYANFSTANSMWISESRENRTARSGCAPSALRRLARCDLGVEFRGFAARDRQRIPIRSREVFGEIDDLPHMVGVVRHLAVDGLHNGMRLG